MEEELIKELHLYVKTRMNDLHNKERSLEEGLKSVKREIQFLSNLVTATGSVVCVNCSGHGKVRVWEAQDSSKIETCTTCKGTGLA